MSASDTSTPPGHPAFQKLDVARARIKTQLLAEIDREQWDSAIGLIAELRGLSIAKEVLRSPDASFDEE